MLLIHLLLLNFQLVCKVVLAAMSDDVEAAASFSDALWKHPSVFSSLYINMLMAGESSGALDDILDRLASYLEKSIALQRKVKSSLKYILRYEVNSTLFA